MFAYPTCKYLLKSWVQFVSQLTRANSVNLKLPQFSNPGSSVYLCPFNSVKSVIQSCRRSVQVGNLFVHSAQSDSPPPTLVLHHLVCFQSWKIFALKVGVQGLAI